MKSALGEYKTLLPYLSRYKGSYIKGLLCLLAVDGAQVILPQFMASAVDLIASGDFTMAAILRPCVAMALIALVISAGRFAWRYYIHGSSRRIEAELRERLFAQYLSLSYDFYQKNRIGDLMARASNDLDAVRNAIGMGLVALVDGTVMAAAILIVIFAQDAGTAALAVIPLPLITVVILLFGRAVGKRFLKVQEAYSALSGTVQETFAGIRVIKSFVTEGWFALKFAANNDAYRGANMGLVTLFGFFFPFVSLLSGLTTLIVLTAGGVRVSLGLLSPGALLALFRYLQMLIWPLMGAGFTVNMIQRGAVSLARVNEVMRTVPLIRSGPYKPPVSPAYGDDGPILEARSLTFTYPGGVKALDNVSLAVKRGEFLGILGRTGSGKSTLIKAFTRMIDPPAGTVWVKGVEIAAWDLSALRETFGVSPQDSSLFSDTLSANIRYGLKGEVDPGSRMGGVAPHTPHWGAEGPPVPPLWDLPGGLVPPVNPIPGGLGGPRPPSRGYGGQRPPSSAQDHSLSFERAAGIAAIDRDLQAFPDGWGTVIGERGLSLSGGQKQRAAIARAIIGLPEALILDDSLSAVDAETEKLILGALLEERRLQAARGRPLTLILVTHRVSALERAGRVIVLDQGRITEEGAPGDLLQRGGFYARTAGLQRLGAGE